MYKRQVQIFIFIFIWLRGTLPRLRYDQFMQFGWKFLIPVSIVWILVVATARVFRNDVSLTSTEILVGGAAVIALLLLGSWLLQARADRRATAQAERAAVGVFEPTPTGFPVPPMPGQQAVLTSRRAQAGTTVVAEPIAPAGPAAEKEDGNA